jgi:hypothetical protein
MIATKAFGALQLPLVRRLVTSPLLRSTPPSSTDSGDRKQELVKPKPKTHFAAAEKKKSDVEIVMNQIEAAIVHPVWSKEQLDSVKVNMAIHYIVSDYRQRAPLKIVMA